MSYLLDTNVVSEAMAAKPESQVMSWMESQPLHSIHLSVITVGEIDFGIIALPAGPKRERLRQWRDTIIDLAGRRLLPVDVRVAAAWAGIRNVAQRAKRTIPAADALIAATAEVHGLTLVTRNARNFVTWDGPILNPWPDASPPWESG